jgi:hypothetical protein
MATIYVINTKQPEVTETVTATSLTAFTDEYVVGPGYSSTLTIGVSNTGQDLTDFAIQVKAHPNADWETRLSGTDWSTATSTLLVPGSGLNTLASGSTDDVVVNLFSAHAYRFAASVASSSTALSVRHTVSFTGGQG